MSLSMHAASVPTFVRTFHNMLSWLDKAQAHAEARKFSPTPTWRCVWRPTCCP